MSVRASQPARPARERLLAAALDLFAENGVSGTSLQMIADRLGVTKAAVYHQFQTKEDIVLAVIGPALDSLAGLADVAETKRSRAARADAALVGVVELVITHRRLAAILHFDPVVSQLVQDHPARESFDRIRRLLTGDDPDPATSVGAAMISGGLIIAGVDPQLATLDDETLRRHLLAVARRLLRISASPDSAR